MSHLTIAARATATAALLTTSLLLSGCVAPAEHDHSGVRTGPTAIPSLLAVPEDRPVAEPWRALALVPVSAEVVTLTDFDRIRARLGGTGLTSASPLADRSVFWASAERESVLLSHGLLRDASAVGLGFTQDDVAWEARFTGPEGDGYVLALHADLDLGRVRTALGEPILRDARLLERQHLLVKGVAADDERVWAMEKDVAALAISSTAGMPMESAYVRRECVPLRTALGDEATYADERAVVAAQDPRFLRPLDAISVEFTDAVATARLGVDRLDLHERAGLVASWPAVGSPTVDDAFEGFPPADPGTGRIGLRLADPEAARTLTLAGRLPFAICNQSP